MSKDNIVKKIAKTTRIWVTIKNGDDEYKITSNADRSVYTLFKKVPLGYEKLGTSKNPFELEEKYIWKDKPKAKKKEAKPKK